ncbi:hypothetical protein DFP72DRAFT_845085 [Ephemerocybe angulata]|uniref:Uncharacterized protein n=1 Tax=Ephemerocybe angulata TaxID=980116 RepID=A0A8H6I753_9AGAR|nr:hypothetical protein DFP72DRAFT_845085 [Tulosesus angulatus]
MSMFSSQTFSSAPAVWDQRQLFLRKLYNVTVAATPNRRKEEEFMLNYSHIAAKAVMSQCGKKSNVFTGPYITEDDIVTHAEGLNTLVLKRRSLVGPSHFQKGQDGFAFVDPENSSYLWKTLDLYQIASLGYWDDPLLNQQWTFKQHAFLIFVEANEKKTTPRWYQYMGVFYIRIFDEFTLDNFADQKHAINDHLMMRRAMEEDPEVAERSSLVIFQMVAEDLHGPRNPFSTPAEES